LGPSQKTLWPLVSQAGSLQAWVSVTAYCLETLNIAKKWGSRTKTSIIQQLGFLLVVFGGRTQPKQVVKMPEIRKNFNSELEVMMAIF